VPATTICMTELHSMANAKRPPKPIATSVRYSSGLVQPSPTPSAAALSRLTTSATAAATVAMCRRKPSIVRPRLIRPATPRAGRGQPGCHRIRQRGEVVEPVTGRPLSRKQSPRPMLGDEGRHSERCQRHEGPDQPQRHHRPQRAIGADGGGDRIGYHGPGDQQRTYERRSWPRSTPSGAAGRTRGASIGFRRNRRTSPTARTRRGTSPGRRSPPPWVCPPPGTLARPIFARSCPST
jgi:hypothetical protein